MEIGKLITIISVILTLSIASERLVEIIKGYIPTLNVEKTDSKAEARRKAKIHMLALMAGIITAFLASPILAGIFKDLFSAPSCPTIFGLFGSAGQNTPCGFDLNGNGIFMVLALGLLASGGSGLWNSILEYLLKIKDLKKVEVEKKKVELETVRELQPYRVARAKEAVNTPLIEE